MSALVDARWTAGYHAVTADGIELVPGVTVTKVPEAEAKASDNWEPVRAKREKPDAGSDS